MADLSFIDVGNELDSRTNPSKREGVMEVQPARLMILYRGLEVL